MLKARKALVLPNGSTSPEDGPVLDLKVRPIKIHNSEHWFCCGWLEDFKRTRTNFQSVARQQLSLIIGGLVESFFLVGNHSN